MPSSTNQGYCYWAQKQGSLEGFSLGFVIGLRSRMGPKPGESDGFPDIPVTMKKLITVYEAGKALLAYITPGYDEVMRVGEGEMMVK